MIKTSFSSMELNSSKQGYCYWGSWSAGKSNHGFFLYSQFLSSDLIPDRIAIIWSTNYFWINNTRAFAWWMIGRVLLFWGKVLTFKEINCMFQFEFRELCPILLIKSLLPFLCMFYSSFFTERILVVQERYCSAAYLRNGPLQPIS